MVGHSSERNDWVPVGAFFFLGFLHGSAELTGH